MWWLVDIIADGDLKTLGGILAAVALLGALIMLL